MKIIKFFILSCVLSWCNNLIASSNNDGFLDYESKKYVQAFPKLVLLAEEGSVKAKGLVGRMYLIGLGVEKNYFESYKWSTRGAVGGDSTAQNILGNLYKNGWGVNQNFEKAAMWFRRSATQGNDLAAVNLARLYEDEKIPGGDVEAYRWFNIAAGLKNATGEIKTAKYLIDGVVVEKNIPRAVELIKSSAAKGNLMAKAHQLNEVYPKNTDIENSYIRKITRLANDIVLKNPKSKDTQNFENSEEIKNILEIFKEENVIDEEDCRYGVCLNFKESYLNKSKEKLEQIKKLTENLPKDENRQYKADLLTLIKFSIYRNLRYRGLWNEPTEELRKEEQRIFFDDLRDFSKYLLDTYDKNLAIYSHGTNLLLDYNLNTRAPGKLLAIKELLDYKRSDTYIAALIADDEISDQAICKLNLSNVLDISIRDSNPLKDQLEEKRKIDYLMDGINSSRNCLDLENKKYLYSRLYSNALWLRDYDLLEYVTLRRVELEKLDTYDIDRHYINRYEHAWALFQKGAPTKAYKVMDALRVDLEKNTENIKTGRVAEMAAVPEAIMTRMYLQNKEFDKAHDSLKRKIKFDLSKVSDFDDSIIKQSLATNFEDLSYVTEFKKNGDQSIYLLKRAFEFERDGIVAFKKLAKGDELLSLYRNSTQTYRRLIELLLRNKRYSEAENIIKFLKADEMAELTRDASILEEPIPFGFYTANELKMNKFFDLTYSVMKKNNIDNQTKSNPNYLKLGKKIDSEFNVFFDFLMGESTTFKEKKERSASLNKIENQKITKNQVLLKSLPEGTVLLQYIVNPAQTFIILTTPSTFIVKEIKLSETDLNAKIYEFRSLLKNDKKDVKKIALEIYQYLFEPIEKDLQKFKAKQVMLSLDGALRYIPFAAIYDGKKFLVQSYDFSIFDDINSSNQLKKNNNNWKVAGFGVSKSINNMSHLPSVREELNAIIKNPAGGIYPGTIKLDKNFTIGELNNSISKEFPVFHIATHFQFSPGTEENSFLQLGDGSTLSLDGIRKMNFNKVDLITFSACQTGMGGGVDEKGKEVAGLSFIAQRNGAKSVIASLWSVSDRSTAQLMSKMYGYKSENKLNKSESLKKAQIDLLNSSNFNHPFYWAPFKIYGNWQ
jgi:CHAT domain-containing protein/TPR repeat protein